MHPADHDYLGRTRDQSHASMTPNMLFLLLAEMLVSCRAPLAPTVDELYVFPPFPAEPYPTERPASSLGQSLHTCLPPTPRSSTGRAPCAPRSSHRRLP